MKVVDSLGREKVTPDLPIGAVVPFFGDTLPDGWALCDGTGGTPDLFERFIVGASAVGTGTPGGARAAWLAPIHTGMASANHSNHVVTQPANHSDHVVTQPSAHSAHAVTQNDAHGTHSSDGGHTHDDHETAARTGGAVGSEWIGPVTHASQGEHTHDAHSAHSGAAVDAHSAHASAAVDAHSAHTGAAVDAHSAHSVTQPSVHAILKHYFLAYIVKQS